MLSRLIRFLNLLALVLTCTACEKEIEMHKNTYVPKLIPNDTWIAQLWGMKKIHAFSAWTTQTDCTNRVVAIVDTGGDLTHEDLQDNLWTNANETAGNSVDDDGNGFTDDLYGADFQNTDGTPTDDNFHGTHVAGTIGARGNNGVGVAGVCWRAKIMHLKALNASGAGTLANVASAIDYARTNGANLINLSVGASSTAAALTTAVANAKAAGILLVAAAGNEGVNLETSPQYPAAYSGTYDNVLSVAATTKTDTLASFSNYSTSLVQIGAPGEEIYSTMPWSQTSEMSAGGYPTQYHKLDGTSMATPLTTGAATLVWAAHPTWTYLQVKEALVARARFVSSLEGKISGGRRLEISDAL